jgi:hypothetical protein
MKNIFKIMFEEIKDGDDVTQKFVVGAICGIILTMIILTASMLIYNQVHMRQVARELAAQRQNAVDQMNLAIAEQKRLPRVVYYREK